MIMGLIYGSLSSIVKDYIHMSMLMLMDRIRKWQRFGRLIEGKLGSISWSSLNKICNKVMTLATSSIYSLHKICIAE